MYKIQVRYIQDTYKVYIYIHMCDVCTLYHDKYKIDNIYMYTYNNVNAHIYILYTYTQKYYALYEKDARC